MSFIFYETRINQGDEPKIQPLDAMLYRRFAPISRGIFETRKDVRANPLCQGQRLTRPAVPAVAIRTASDSEGKSIPSSVNRTSSIGCQ